MNLKELKVGDKVRIVSDLSKCPNINSNGKMDHWQGKIMTVREIDLSGKPTVRMVEDRGEWVGEGWHWFADMIECKVNTFTKADLKNGMIVETLKGDRYMVMLNTPVGDNLISKDGWLPLSSYNDDLSYNSYSPESFSVKAIYKPTHEHMFEPRFWHEITKVVYEAAPQHIEISEDEKAVLRLLNDRYKYIARDEDGELYVYECEPSKSYSTWSAGGTYDELALLEHNFQSIKWSDSKPHLISDLIGE